MTAKTNPVLAAFDHVDHEVAAAVQCHKLNDEQKLELVSMLAEHYNTVADNLSTDEPEGAQVIDAADPYAEMDVCPTCGTWLKETVK